MEQPQTCTELGELLHSVHSWHLFVLFLRNSIEILCFILEIFIFLQTIPAFAFLTEADYRLSTLEVWKAELA